MKTTHCLGTLLPLLLIPALTPCAAHAQSSPSPAILDYDQTSLPVGYRVGGDTTFCKSQVVILHGEYFKRATGGESWDTTMVHLGANRIWPLSIASQSAGTDDRIVLQLPSIYVNDTCLLLQVTKRTLSPPDTFYYVAKDTICLTGDVVQITYPSSLFCLGDTNPRPQIMLSPGTTGAFCCPLGAASFGVFPQTGEVPLHAGAVGPANQFLYCSSHPRCGDTVTFTVAIQPRQASTATLNGQTQYTICQSSPPLRPDSANLFPSGGVFRSWSGLVVVDSLTGLFAPALSSAGLHTLWYVPSLPCHDSTRITIDLLPTATASLGYPAIPSYLGIPTLCDDALLVSPVFTHGSAGGVFLSSPPGLTLSGTGAIDPASSSPGTYSVQYITPGLCTDTVTVLPALKIDTVIPAVFSLPQTYSCISDTLFPQAQSSSGIWQVIGPSPSAQIVHSQASAAISLSTTGLAPATYELRHVTSGYCGDTSVLPFTLTPADDPSFSYPPNGNFCMGDPDPWPLVTGMGGGTFTAVTPATVVDPDGRLRLQASGAGAHTIRYTTSGYCPDSTDLTVNIFGTASANFAYAASLFCSADTNPLPQILGTPGGVFSGDSGLAVVAATGEILLSSCQSGTWNVTYTLTGSCQAQFTQTVQISPTDSSTVVEYPQVGYCQANNDPFPVILGDTLGSFVAGAGIVFANTDMGQLDLSAMQPGGPYFVYYDVDNRCAMDTRDSIWIYLPDDPGFSYPQSSYCEGAVNPLPSTIAQVGGIFTEPTLSVLFANDSTGEIDARMSMPGGPYFITYTTAGPCPESMVQQVTLLNKPYAARLMVAPDSVYCQGEEVFVQAQAGGAVEWRWYLNGMGLGEAEDAHMFAADEVGKGVDGHDTVAVAMENTHGCSDSVVVVLQGLPAPRIETHVLHAETNALGAATVEIEFRTDNAGTVIDWQAAGVNLENISPASGLTVAFGPDSVVALELRCGFQSPYDLAELMLFLAPYNASCQGYPDTVKVHLSPQTDAIFIPEVFTPDGNGQNDTWMISVQPGIDPAEFKLLLFNGAGGKVLDMDGLRQDFDGSALPDGVYWWVLSDAAGAVVQNGGVTIRRK